MIFDFLSRRVGKDNILPVYVLMEKKDRLDRILPYNYKGENYEKIIYWNLESGRIVTVSKDFNLTFKNNNAIIELSIDDAEDDYYKREEEFARIREEYYQLLLTLSSDEAIAKIKETYHFEDDKCLTRIKDKKGEK